MARKHLGDTVLPHLLELIETLRKHREFDRFPYFHKARRRLDGALDDFEQRGFTGAVLSQDAVAVARPDHPVDAVQNRLPSEFLGHTRKLHHALAQALHGRGTQFERITRRRLALDELNGALHVELRLGGTRPCPAREPGELFSGQAFATLFGNLRHALTLHALQDIGGIASLERVDPTVMDLPHARSHLVEKPSVVGNHEKRALTLGPARRKMAREPRDRAHIQMVRRLVEHENVPVADKQTSEVDATALAARQRAHLRIPRNIGDERGYDLADARIARPQIFGHIAHHGALHRLVVGERIHLPQKPHGQAARAAHEAPFELHGAGEHAQKGGLAVAVLAHDTNAVALVDPKGHFVQNLLGRIFQTGAFAPKHKRHVCSFSRMRGARKAARRHEHSCIAVVKPIHYRALRKPIRKPIRKLQTLSRHFDAEGASPNGGSAPE